MFIAWKRKLLIFNVLEKLHGLLPKGHAKEGQPLDKVCFIGQSGTGKTTLLELLGAACINADPNSSNFYDFGFEKREGANISFQSKTDKMNIGIGYQGAYSGDKIIEETLIERLLFFPTGLSNLTFDNVGNSESEILQEQIVEYGKKAIKFYPFYQKL